MIVPSNKVDTQLIIDEWDHIQRIMATLALKETTQSVIVKKICTYSQQNITARALWEFEKLLKSLYTVRYLNDPVLHQAIQHSQNRIEGYHHLRSVLAQINGKKQLSGQTDIDVEISNQCGLLLAAIVANYNSEILSRIVDRHVEKGGNPESLEWIKHVSPIAWQHIHLLGHYSFCNQANRIDLSDLLAQITLP